MPAPIPFTGVYPILATPFDDANITEGVVAQLRTLLDRTLPGVDITRPIRL